MGSHSQHLPMSSMYTSLVECPILGVARLRVNPSTRLSWQSIMERARRSLEEPLLVARRLHDPASWALTQLRRWTSSTDSPTVRTLSNDVERDGQLRTKTNRRRSHSPLWKKNRVTAIRKMKGSMLHG